MSQLAVPHGLAPESRQLMETTCADTELGSAAQVIHDKGQLILHHCLAALLDAFSIVAPAYMARVQRIGRLAADLGRLQRVDHPDTLEGLAFAAQLGSLTLPESTMLKMHRGELLTSTERHDVRNAPKLGERLLSRIPGFEREREIVRLHDVHAVSPGELPVEAAILRVAIGFDRLEASGKTPAEAIKLLRDRDPMYSSEILDTLSVYTVAGDQSDRVRSILIADLTSGAVLAADIISSDGVLQLGVGHRLNTVVIERLQILAKRHLIADTVWVS